MVQEPLRPGAFLTDIADVLAIPRGRRPTDIEPPIDQRWHGGDLP